MMTTLKTLILISLKVFSSVYIAYLLAFIGQELFSYASFSFIFIFLSTGSGFFYFLKPYKIKGLLILNAVLIALLFLLNIYISVAYIPV